jgi:hypothetical protein
MGVWTPKFTSLDFPGQQTEIDQYSALKIQLSALFHTSLFLHGESQVILARILASRLTLLLQLDSRWETSHNGNQTTYTTVTFRSNFPCQF